MNTYTLVAEGANGIILGDFQFDPSDPSSKASVLQAAWEEVSKYPEAWDTHYISYWLGNKCLGRL